MVVKKVQFDNFRFYWEWRELKQLLILGYIDWYLVLDMLFILSLIPGGTNHYQHWKSSIFWSFDYFLKEAFSEFEFWTKITQSVLKLETYHLFYLIPFTYNSFLYIPVVLTSFPLMVPFPIHCQKYSQNQHPGCLSVFLAWAKNQENFQTTLRVKTGIKLLFINHEKNCGELLLRISLIRIAQVNDFVFRNWGDVFVCWEIR